jgi:hypothetical protein
MDNFDLRKYLVENKITTNSKMLKENKEVPHAQNTLHSVTIGNTTYEVGGQDPNDDGIIITIEKHPNGYFIVGQAGAEGYGYGLDFEGTMVEEDTLGENKVTVNSQMMNEYSENSSESVAEAFAKAGIDLTKPVYIVETGGGPGGSFEEAKRILGKKAVAVLEKERSMAKQDEASVIFDYDVAQAFPPEDLDVPSNLVAKISMVIEDTYEFVIFQ